jgi:tetratricopeptide (TPR) repeat protein
LQRWAEHKCYRGKVENNLGFLYFKAGKFKEAHDHLERARRLLSSIKDYDSVAQVDETRARVFLAQGYNLKAEKAARAAVITLEKGGRQDLLAEALIAHGTALARLGCYSQSYATLQHAIEAAQQAGALDRAGEAALILVKELGENIGFERVQTTFSGYGLGETLRRYEKDVIKQALVKAEGSVTRAARLLGVSHQRLIYIINGRHKELLYVRTPATRRHKSIIKR